ncbi:MAG: hypothetical protein HUU21_21395 [Polyangiaceae bacterium]|nr:hypothetical protein [Polyangiaceae bacterium]
MASSARVEYRFRRTASTENTRAFADVRMLAMRDAARRYRKTPWFSFLGKRWDATLDAYVCNVCGVLDGEVVPWHEPFPNDAIPGYLHPSCRCAMTTIFSPGGLKREARRRPASAQRPPGPTKATQ